MSSSPPRVTLLVGAVAAMAAGGAVVGALLLRMGSSATPSVTPEAAPGASTTAEPAVARPRQEPGPGGKRPAVRDVQPPVVDDAWRAELTQKVIGLPRPGEAAFSAYADRFVDLNLDMAQEQARREKLTIPEVRALTRLGLMVMATQRVPEVEAVLGHELPADKREALSKLESDLNSQFKAEMRALVAKGVAEAERWELISSTDARYRQAYLAITGMTPESFDDLLAQDLLLPSSPPSSGAEAPPGKRDTVATPPRPGTSPIP